ncbi:MAG TPA: xanthine dehydrogenase accessory protein XdhC [Geminicoccaceae bacterium]|nr:xanthine dehydrogenase accessory protein XdhC [Geminicoccaceae bacterium]
MTALAPILRQLLAAQQPVVLVRVAKAKGSTPREAGVGMLVTADATHGTIGGGRLEWEATSRARQLLAGDARTSSFEMPLGPAVGQCCGGHVRIELMRASAAELDALAAAEARSQESLPTVLLFGAGHVGKALARALAPLPLRLRWIDGRADEFPDPPLTGPEVVLTERPLAEIRTAPAGSAYVVMTHSHGLDFEICEAVLERDDFAYLGLIGSRTKRARFERGWRELGRSERQIGRLVCPIGGPLRDKRPAVIAALVAAEILHALAAPATNREHKTTGEAAA